MWFQRTVTLSPHPRGCHLVTRDLLDELPELADMRVGLAHFFIQHTSASLTLNENASPAVRHDLERHLNEMVPEQAGYWTHTAEGPDDMPAHVKSSLMGPHLTVPVSDGELLLGTWQGIYLCEHRNHGGRRRIVVTLHGE